MCILTDNAILASISELSVDISDTFSDDPISRFIQLRGSMAATRSDPASMQNTSVIGQQYLYDNVLCVLELMVIKMNIVCVPFVFVNRNNRNVCISAVCSNRS